MNTEQLRSSFLCHVYSKHEEARNVVELIKNAGYQTEVSIDDDNLFFESLKKNPPHLICLFQYEFNELEAKSFQLRVRKLLPESAIYWIGNQQQVALVYDRVGFGFYGVLGWPLSHVSQLIQNLDHAIAAAYYQYENEQLKEQKQQAEPAPTRAAVEAPSSVDSYRHIDFQKSLFQQLSFASSLEHFMKHTESIIKPVDGHAVFFKYVGARKTLVYQKGANIDVADLQDVGLNFSDIDSQFKKSDIRNVEKHPAFLAMLREVFSIERFHLVRLEVAGEVQGVLVLWNVNPESSTYRWIETSFALLAHQFLGLELERRLHSNQLVDPTSQAMTKHHFMQRISEEVARARRTSLPLSFVLMSVDPFFELQGQFHKEDLDLFLKSLVKIIQKHSRVNDMVGRFGQDEFALLLPHTAAKGAAIKAERIRRMIESADFSQILPGFSSVTLSLGVSEYPSLCRDGDELFQSADRALFELKKTERNKVILAQAAEGFIADFVIPKPNY